MHTNRRNFLKLSAVAATATAFGGLGLGCTPKAKIADRAAAMSPKWSKQTTSACCYCAVGCGLVVNTSLKDNRAINVEGDPDHPVNEGSLCAKGASIWQLAENDRRPDSVLYRAPYSSKFQKISLHKALEMIAERVKKPATRPSPAPMQRVRSSTAATASPRSVPPLSTTRSAGPSRQCSAASAWCT